MIWKSRCVPHHMEETLARTSLYFRKLKKGTDKNLKLDCNCPRESLCFRGKFNNSGQGEHPCVRWVIFFFCNKYDGDMRLLCCIQVQIKNS